MLLIVLLATLAYLLPFISMEKSRTVLFQLSGAELITSETFYTTGVAQPHEVPSDPCLLTAVILGGVALFTGFAPRQRGLRRASAVAALGACVALVLFPITTAARIPAVLPPPGVLHLAAGYWTSLSCYLLSAGITGLRGSSRIQF